MARKKIGIQMGKETEPPKTVEVYLRGPLSKNTLEYMASESKLPKEPFIHFGTLGTGNLKILPEPKFKKGYIKYEPPQSDLTPFGLLQENLENQENQMFNKAERLAKQLKDKYNLKDVRVVNTDDDAYSDQSKELIITKGVYSISLQNPEATQKACDWQISLQAQRDAYLAAESKEQKRGYLIKANEKRAERSNHNLESLSPVVTRIINEYKEKNQGKNPPLRKVAELLNNENIPSPGSTSPKWFAPAVKRVIDASKSNRQR